MVCGCLLLGMPVTQHITVDEVGADVAFKEAQLRAGGQWAACGQVATVVDHQVGVVQAGRVQVQWSGVQPGDSGVDKEGVDFRIQFHQVQGVCHHGDLGPLHQGGQGLGWVCTVVQDADASLLCGRQRAVRAQALLGAVVLQGCGQDAAVPAVGDEGLEHSVLNHALHGAHRQAQLFGGLAGTDIDLCVLRYFHSAVALG
jgi:hypothetical protein